MEQYWEPAAGKNKKPKKDDMVQMLMKSDISQEIAEEVANQVSSNDDSNNVVFIFTDNNEYVVTGIHVPAEALDGNRGPVLMRGSNEKSITAAFSRDYIAECLARVESEEEKPGLSGVSDARWIEELENLAEMVRMEIQTNPPESWDELLAGE